MFDSAKWLCVVIFSEDGPVVASSAADRDNCDTVGAVALDASGNFAYATSTGGITAKLFGRVGDSPLVGQYRIRS